MGGIIECPQAMHVRAVGGIRSDMTRGHQLSNRIATNRSRLGVKILHNFQQENMKTGTEFEGGNNVDK